MSWSSCSAESPSAFVMSSDLDDPTQQSERSSRRYLPNLAVALAMGAVFTAFLGVLLTAAEDIGLSAGQTNGWIMAVFGIPGIVGFVLTWQFRVPMLLTGNAFIIVFIARVGTDYSWAELVGASMLAGLAVLIMVPLGLTDVIARLLPAPIVFGLLAGAVFPFIIEMFTAINQDLMLVGGTVVVFLAAKVLLEPRVPAILPALLAGVLLALLGGGLTSQPGGAVQLLPTITVPEFTVGSVLTVAPVMLVLITVQANIPSTVFLREQGFEPPERLLTLLSGGGTIGSSLLGPVGVSLSLPATAYTAGQEAGPLTGRYRGVLLGSLVLFAFAPIAGFATLLARVVPAALLTVVAGLALLGVLADALKKVSSGPLVLGPLVAFSIAMSDLSLAGFGPFFWAIVGGVVVSRAVEHRGWNELHDEPTASQS